MLVLSWPMTSRRERAFPSVSYMLTPSCSMAAWALLLLDMRLSMARREVPAFCALMPELARMPLARARSSME